MTDYVPVQLAFSSIEPGNFDKEKTPIIFLHGLTASKEHWNDIPQIVADTTKRKVYTIDARNHGDSEGSDVFNFDCNMYDLENFMDSVGIPKAILVGHSMGGITSMKTSLHRPERVEKLITEDISVRRVPAELLAMRMPLVKLLTAALDQVPADVDEDAAHKIIGEYLFENFPQDLTQKFKLKNTISSLPRFPLKRTADGRYAVKTNFEPIVKALGQGDKLMSDYTGVYEGPAYFIYGAASPLSVGKDGDLIKPFFPKAEFLCIENAGHSIHSDCPKEFIDVLLKCLLN